MSTRRIKVETGGGQTVESAAASHCRVLLEQDPEEGAAQAPGTTPGQWRLLDALLLGGEVAAGSEDYLGAMMLLHRLDATEALLERAMPRIVHGYLTACRCGDGAYTASCAHPCPLQT